MSIKYSHRKRKEGKKAEGKDRREGREQRESKYSKSPYRGKSLYFLYVELKKKKNPQKKYTKTSMVVTSVK